jgi:hypothetical protein
VGKDLFVDFHSCADLVSGTEGEHVLRELAALVANGFNRVSIGARLRFVAESPVYTDDERAAFQLAYDAMVR